MSNIFMSLKVCLILIQSEYELDLGLQKRSHVSFGVGHQNQSWGADVNIFSSGVNIARGTTDPGY